MREYFILNGVDSRDFGVYISGQGTFSAPEKAYTFYNIPGRNGALLGNEHRLENIEVSYEAFIYTDFDNQIAAFRSFLLSINGYAKLTDSYHPDEYRMAVYQGPFEPTVERTNDAGKFVITFSCKPQRFLTSGDTVYRWTASGGQVITGREITVDASQVDPSKLSWAFDTPHNVECSLVSGRGQASGYVTSILLENYVQVDYKDENGNFIYDKRYRAAIGRDITKASANLITGSVTINDECIATPTTGWSKTADNTFRVSVSGWGAVLASLRTEYPRTSPSPTMPSNYEYVVVNTVSDLDNENYACCYTNGYYYVKDIDYSTATAYQEAKGGHLVDVQWSSAQTVSITPYVPDYPATGFFTLYGQYNGPYFAQDETLTVEYYQSDTMSNPTVFPSAPLIRAVGNGSFTMDGVLVTITGATEYTDIDCELMDCYEGSTNRNNDVTFSTYDFPMLRPGDNAIEITQNSGISRLEITPRWWRV